MMVVVMLRMLSNDDGDSDRWLMMVMTTMLVMKDSTSTDRCLLARPQRLDA